MALPRGACIPRIHLEPRFDVQDVAVFRLFQECNDRRDLQILRGNGRAMHLKVSQAPLTNRTSGKLRRLGVTFPEKKIVVRVANAMGLSRNDYTRLQGDYEKAKIFKADPFAVFDQEDVSKLIEMAVSRVR